MVGQGQEQRGLVQEFVCVVQPHFGPRAQTLTPGEKRDMWIRGCKFVTRGLLMLVRLLPGNRIFVVGGDGSLRLLF